MCSAVGQSPRRLSVLSKRPWVSPRLATEPRPQGGDDHRGSRRWHHRVPGPEGNLVPSEIRFDATERETTTTQRVCRCPVRSPAVACPGRERERGAQRAVPSSLMWAVLHSSSSSVVVVCSSLSSGRPPARRSSRTAHAHAHTQRWLWAPGTTHTTPRGHPTRAPHTLLARWHTRRRRRLS